MLKRLLNRKISITVTDRLELSLIFVLLFSILLLFLIFRPIYSEIFGQQCDDSSEIFHKFT